MTASLRGGIGASNNRVFGYKWPLRNNQIIFWRYKKLKLLYLFHGQEFQKRKNQMPVQKMCYLGCQIVVRHLGWLQNPTLLTNRERKSRRIRGKLRHFIYLGIIIFFGQNYSKIQLSKSNMKILTAQKNNQKQVTSVQIKKGKKTRTLR